MGVGMGVGMEWNYLIEFLDYLGEDEGFVGEGKGMEI